MFLCEELIRGEFAEANLRFGFEKAVSETSTFGSLTTAVPRTSLLHFSRGEVAARPQYPFTPCWICVDAEPPELVEEAVVCFTLDGLATGLRWHGSSRSLLHFLAIALRQYLFTSCRFCADAALSGQMRRG